MKRLLLLPFMLCAALNASSQYTAGTVFSGYTDINPDQLLFYTIVPSSHNTVLLNMFGDAANDIELRADAGSSPGGTAAYINVIPLNPDVRIRFGRLDSVYIPAYSFWDVTPVSQPLAYGDELDPPSARWSDTMQYLTDHSGYGGGNKNVNDWVGGERYIGLKYQSGANVAYGWIRVHFETADSCYVREYSYTPATVGITENSFSDAVSAYPNPLNDHFFLRGSFDPKELELTDMYGKAVPFSTERSGDETKVIPDPASPAGCYMLVYRSAQHSYTKRLIKMK